MPSRRTATALIASGPLAARAEPRLARSPSPGRPLLALVNPLGGITRLEQERVAGAIPDFFRELAKRAGMPLHLELLPRARVVAQWQDGGADLVVGTRPRQMNPHADFVPIVRLRVMLVFDRRQASAAPQDTLALVERSDWRGLMVRGAALTDAIQGLVDRLEARKRLWLVRDWTTVLRMLLAERAEFTLFSPTLMHGESSWMDREARERLVARPLSDVKPHEIGVHLSSRLAPEVRAQLVLHTSAMARDGTLRRLLLRDHPPELLAQDLQFLDSSEISP